MLPQPFSSLCPFRRPKLTTVHGQVFILLPMQLELLPTPLQQLCSLPRPSDSSLLSLPLHRCGGLPVKMMPCLHTSLPSFMTFSLRGDSKLALLFALVNRVEQRWHVPYLLWPLRPLQSPWEKAQAERRYGPVIPVSPVDSQPAPRNRAANLACSYPQMHGVAQNHPAGASLNYQPTESWVITGCYLKPLNSGVVCYTVTSN